MRKFGVFFSPDARHYQESEKGGPEDPPDRAECRSDYFAAGEPAGLLSTALLVFAPSAFFTSGETLGLMLPSGTLTSAFLPSTVGDAAGDAVGEDAGLADVFGAAVGFVSGVVVQAAKPKLIATASVANINDLLIVFSLFWVVCNRDGQ